MNKYIRDRYILDSDGRPQPTPAGMSHEQEMELLQKTPPLARDECAACCVSTVFFGMDMSDTPGEAPMVYETIPYTHVMDADRIRYFKVKFWRYPTRELALQGHQQAVATLQKKRKKPLKPADMTAS